LRELFHPDVIAIHRLAIAAAEESPEIPRLLDERAR
jgi:hypothetical protein